MYRNSHDVKYIGELFMRYHHLISVICLKHLKNQDDAQDTTMDIFEVLTHDLKKHQVKQFKAWIMTVTKNLCYKRLRKSAHLTVDENMLKDEGAFMEMEAGASLNEIKETQLVRMEQYLEEIPADQSQCLKLFFLENKSYQEISDQTGMTLNEVKSHLQNGKRNLRIRMEKT